MDLGLSDKVCAYCGEVAEGPLESVRDATARGGWEIRHYQWCNFRMGAIASTIFLLNMAAFHIFIGFVFAWRAVARMRKRVV